MYTHLRTKIFKSFTHSQAQQIPHKIPFGSAPSQSSLKVDMINDYIMFMSLSQSSVLIQDFHHRWQSIEASMFKHVLAQLRILISKYKNYQNIALEILKSVALRRGQLELDPSYVVPLRTSTHNSRLSKPLPCTKDVQTGCPGKPLRSLSQTQVGWNPLQRRVRSPT